MSRIETQMDQIGFIEAVNGKYQTLIRDDGSISLVHKKTARAFTICKEAGWYIIHENGGRPMIKTNSLERLVDLFMLGNLGERFYR